MHIHASKLQTLELFRFLDQRHRLQLVLEKKHPKAWVGPSAGLRTKQKNRLILDARPPNPYEDTLGSWSKTLGAISAVLQIELLPSHNLCMSGTDLQDYYYCFKATRARAERNTFNQPPPTT